MIVTISGGTCSGKTEFALRCQDFGFERVITNTTRKRRVDDNDNSYHFLTVDEFRNKLDNGEMLEYTEYNGNLYGCSVDCLIDNCVVVLEPNGVRALREKLGDKVISVYLKVSEKERFKRGILRGDSEDTIKQRIEEDKELFNDSFENDVDIVFMDMKKDDICNMISTTLLDYIKEKDS